MIVTRTSFDMDPFVVASLSRKTYRTRIIRHNLNPTFEEKMVFQVMRHEQKYSLNFSVVDRDKFSGNDFVGTVSFPLSTLTSDAPDADPDTGLYDLQEPADTSALPTPKTSRFRLPLSRSSSAQSLKSLARPGLTSRSSQNSVLTNNQAEVPAVPTSAPLDANRLAPTSNGAPPPGIGEVPSLQQSEDAIMKAYALPLLLKNKERWEDKHNPQLFIKAKYLPYDALRQQFWRAMLKQYDSDENRRVSKVELTTMLDTLGSTLKDATIDSFFTRFGSGTDMSDPTLSYDHAVMCLEDQLLRTGPRKTLGSRVKAHIDHVPHVSLVSTKSGGTKVGDDKVIDKEADLPRNDDANQPRVPAIAQPPTGSAGEEGDLLEDDLNDEGNEEHVVEIRECPLCHQPRLNKKSDADIITHVATCASQDWRQVNNIVMAGFVTSSQAQRKWYSKVINKVSYGGYKLGANSANILVQDRMTGQINEERMSVYVRLGIRLLYKGLKSRDMEKKRSKSPVIP